MIQGSEGQLEITPQKTRSLVRKQKLLQEYSLELSIVTTYGISLTLGTLCPLRALGLLGYRGKWKTVFQPSHIQYFQFKYSCDPFVQVILMPEVQARTGTPQPLSNRPYPA